MINIPAITSLLAEILFVAVAALILFRFRNRLSLAPLFIFVGTNQFLGVALAATVYLVVGDDTFVSPGSIVLFSSYLFVILLVYLRTDIPTTRGLIYGIVLANVTLTILLWITAYQLASYETQNILNVPVELFAASPKFFLFGTLMLIIDSLLVVLLYDFLTFRVSWLPLSARVCLTLVTILFLDAVAFTFALAAGEPYFVDVLRGQVIGKTISALAYALILVAYTKIYEPRLREYRVDHVTDIFSIFTHREKYHEVKEKLKVSEKSNLAKTRFLTHMSHELRTPLNAIIGFTKVLVDRRTEDDEEKLYLTRVLHNGKHLLLLINGLLDLSKIDSGTQDLQITHFDLSLLLRETMEQLEGQAVGKAIELKVQLPEEPFWLDSDRLRLQQVLINLIGNAIKFTSEGEVAVHLTTGSGADAFARIDIIDTGIGIPEDELDSIFEPFFHASSNTQIDSGTGLGLPISYALCKQLGYWLHVKSTPGKGSVFSISINREAQAEVNSDTTDKPVSDG